MLKKFLFYCLTLLICSQITAQKFIAFKNDQGKWGYKEEKTGVVKITPQYEEARGFVGLMDWYSYAAVRKNGKWGIIDKQEKVVLDFVHDKISDYTNSNTLFFSKDGFIVKRDNKWCFALPEAMYMCTHQYIDDLSKKLEKEYKEWEKRGWSLEEYDGTYDVNTAFAYYKEEAENGKVESMVTVARWYLNGMDDLGERVEKNEREAFKWYSKAAAKGDPGAIVEVAKLHLKGKGTPVNISEGFQLLKRESDRGNRYAYSVLAELYRDGIGTTKNLDETLRLYKKAAEKGSVMDWYRLGKFYSTPGVHENPAEAFACFLKGATSLSHSQYEIAQCYYYGYGVQKDIRKAVEFLNYDLVIKVYGEDPDYWNLKAYCYFELGNFKKAMEYLDWALKRDPSYANAYDSKGEMFLGIGDLFKAIEYYRKAAAMGYQNSIDWLKKNKIDLTEKYKKQSTPGELNGEEKIYYYNTNIGWPQAIGKEYNGKRVGEWHFYVYKGGLDVIQNHNDDGKLHGESIYYFENGEKREEAIYENGNVKDIKSYYHPNGKLLGRERYSNGKLVRFDTFYDDKGNPILENGTGYILGYNRAGKITARVNYKNNSRDGRAQWYYDNGQLSEEAIYKYSASDYSGLRWEVIAVYDQNGNALDKGTLKDGNGTWKRYDANGVLTEIRTYQNGVLIKTDKYKDGKIVQ